MHGSYIISNESNRNLKSLLKKPIAFGSMLFSTKLISKRMSIRWSKYNVYDEWIGNTIRQGTEYFFK